MKKVVNETIHFVKNKLIGEASGHDWWHIARVFNNANKIAQKESVDLFIVQLAALLHDIADWKMHDGDILAGPRIARAFLNEMNVEGNVIDHVCDIIQRISFKGAKTRLEILTKEGQVVQDADRLDAIGAIGIARAFAYGGYKNREIYNPEVKPILHESFEQYKNNSAPSINHFYEKLLLLKNLMNTNTAKEMALKRHKFMELFLEEFYQEIDG
jgi:uncharacterized protein